MMRSVLNGNVPLLFNHPSVLEALKIGNIKAVGLANNHVLDLPHCFSGTLQKLSEANISYTGAATTLKDAEMPAVFYKGGKPIYFFNFCWDFLLYNHKNPSSGVYVSVLNEQRLFKEILIHRKSQPKSKIVIFLHWSFDLETLPFPMYRQFSRALIDSGANLVVGTHSHCVQGGEKYKDGYIVYGLGNFFLPYNTFAGSYLTFPDFARTELALEWDVTT